MCIRDRVFSNVLSSDDFKSITPDTLYSPETMSRMARYDNSLEIVEMLPFCSRSLNVLTDEIISPDNITKEVLNFLPKRKSSDVEKEKKDFENIRKITDELQIEDGLFDIVHDLLEYGDQFIEICDYNSEEVPITQSLLNEGETPDKLKEYTKEYELSYEDRVLSENKTLIETKKKTFNVKTELVIEAEKSIDDDKKERDLKDIRLLIHDPRTVIKLQSVRFRICLGYLILPPPNNTYTSSSGISNSYTFKTRYYSSAYQPSLIGIERIYDDLMANIKKHIGRNSLKSDLKVDKKEVMDMLTRTVAEYEEEKNKPFRVRYVPPDRLEHFVIGGRKFFPYGESIFQRTTFASKLLIALETALTVKRISDSSEKRIIYIESALPRTVKNMIESVKESLKKRKYTLDSLGNIGSIPSVVTTYEDYYIPQNKGKRFIEFDQLQPTVQIRELSEELKFFRDQLVSALDVPPAFINLEENLSNKAALTHESILFARTIVAYQKVISKPILGLYRKIYKFVYGEPLSTSVNIQLPKPQLLQMERDAENYDNIIRIITSLKEIGIPEEYLKKKFLSIDWEEIKEFETKSNLDKQMGAKEEDEMESGGF